jgi:hypothetical protein
MTRNREAALRSTIYPNGIAATLSPFCYFYMPSLMHHQHPLGQAILEKCWYYRDGSKLQISICSPAHSRDHHYKSFVQDRGRNLLKRFGPVSSKCEMTKGQSSRQ